MTLIRPAPQVLTRDKDVVKFMLNTGFSEFERGRTISLVNGSFFGKGIFGSDGDRAKMVSHHT